MARTNFDQLLQAGCHFGHLKRKWNPAMAPYIYTERNGIDVGSHCGVPLTLQVAEVTACLQQLEIGRAHV